MVAITPDTLDRLRETLPALAFDPALDPHVGEQAAFAAYRQFYELDFDATLPEAFHAMGRVEAAGYRIACHYWLPDRARPSAAKGTVLVVHGYFDHVGLFDHLIEYLLARDYAVVAFDLPGHGLSDGERASIETFDHYVAVLEAIVACVRAALPAPLSAIGQSTGGAVVLKHILERGCDTFDRAVLLAPLVEPALWPLNNALYALVHRFLERIPRKFLASSHDEAFLDFLFSRDPLQDRHVPMAWIGAMKAWIREIRSAPPSPCPVTILQGTLDTTLAWRRNLKILRRAFPNAAIRQVPGARHHMANEALPLRDRIFDAIGF